MLTDARDRAVGYMENMQKQAEDKKVEVEGKLAEGKAKINKVLDSVDAKKAAVTI